MRLSFCIDGNDFRNPVALDSEFCHSCAHVQFAAVVLHQRCHVLPQLAGAKLRVEEAFDQRCLHTLLA